MGEELSYLWRRRGGMDPGDGSLTGFLDAAGWSRSDCADVVLAVSEASPTPPNTPIPAVLGG